VLRLGHAVGQVLQRAAKGRRPTVLIGKDTRISGYMLESALEAGFASAGVSVLLTGPLPTPGVAYLTRALRLDLGVVISASHNAFPDNGIKFFSAKGEKLPDAWESRWSGRWTSLRPGWTRPAWASPPSGRCAGRYVEFCKSTVSGN
jgi:phosphoglucosamine mutase